MQRRKKLETLFEEDNTETQKFGRSLRQFSTAHMWNWRSLSVPGGREGTLNMSPSIPRTNHAVYQESGLCDKSLSHIQEISSRQSSTATVGSNETAFPRSRSELVKEISTIEKEIYQMEQQLLLFYRSSCDHCQAPSLPVTHNLVHDSLKWNGHHETPDMSRAFPGNLSPAVHFGTSKDFDVLGYNPCKLSEEIVRCISSIYCKLAGPQRSQINTIASPEYSESSSSPVSPSHIYSWSPQYQYEDSNPYQFGQLNDKNGQSGGLIEVSKLQLDGVRFEYVTKMLDSLSSVVNYLKNIDPRKLSYGEQVAFWINIHNALVMHAILTGGLRQGHVKSTSSIRKAAYNVGGHSVNAYVIQTLILGCQPHLSTPWLRMMFSPSMKFVIGKSKHPFALTHIEPLAHFALCLGAHSDPVVRVYTADHVFQELQVARDEFVRSNVKAKTDRNKVFLPKILYYYWKDTSLKMTELLEMVSEMMPEVERKSIRQCLEGQSDKCYAWFPYNSGFRYLLLRDFTKNLGF